MFLHSMHVFEVSPNAVVVRALEHTCESGNHWAVFNGTSKTLAFKHRNQLLNFHSCFSLKSMHGWSKSGKCYISLCVSNILKKVPVLREIMMWEGIPRI